MARIINPNKCRDCAHVIPYTGGHLTVKDSLPVLADCKIRVYGDAKIPLSWEACKEFKRNQSRGKL